MAWDKKKLKSVWEKLTSFFFYSFFPLPLSVFADTQEMMCSVKCGGLVMQLMLTEHLIAALYSHTFILQFPIDIRHRTTEGNILYT